MKYEEIIKLLDAGYTRDEIIQMQDEPKQDEPKQDEPKQDEPKQAADVTNEVLSELKTLFEDMKKEFTAMNIMNSRQKEDETITGDNAIANIINPFKKEGK